MIAPRILAVAAIFAAGAAAADQKPDQGTAFGNPEKLEEQGGEAIFLHLCAGCHMPDAEGATGAGAYPSLAGNKKLEAAGYPIALVLHGQKAMPPLGAYLSNQQVADVVNFLRSNFGNEYDDAVTEADIGAAR